jgi:hypothetical protein
MEEGHHMNPKEKLQNSASQVVRDVLCFIDIFKVFE